MSFSLSKMGPFSTFSLYKDHKQSYPFLSLSSMAQLDQDFINWEGKTKQKGGKLGEEGKRRFLQISSIHLHTKPNPHQEKPVVKIWYLKYPSATSQKNPIFLHHCLNSLFSQKKTFFFFFFYTKLCGQAASFLSLLSWSEFFHRENRKARTFLTSLSTLILCFYYFFHPSPLISSFFLFLFNSLPQLSLPLSLSAILSPQFLLD